MFPSADTGSAQADKAKELLMVVAGVDWIEPLDAYELLYRPHSFILESVAGSSRTARYSLVGIDPLLIYESKNGVSKKTEDGITVVGGGDPLTEIAGIMKKYEVSGPKNIPAGAVGFLSYDVSRYIEKLPDTAADDLSLPDCVFMIMKTYLWFDHVRRRVKVACLTEPRDKNDAEWRINELKSFFMSKKEERRGISEVFRSNLDFTSNFNKRDFESAVVRAKEYIFAGDIYQVNLSQRLTTPITGAGPLDIYKQLRNVNPSPFAAFFEFGDWQMVSCSPERLVKLDGDKIETRPIAGTIRRGAGPLEDSRLTERLISDIKERAEHIMLVDLERNDLGRVAEFGSVSVDELMVTEGYSHVTHIVSNVIGRLRGDKTRFDLVRACFPGGTITGCPKIRAMEIIEELEPVKRGPYTGSMGYFGFNGDMDLNIIIRTFIIKDALAHVQVGAGIVADSIPEKEYFETMYKAEALIKAASLAEAAYHD